MMSNIENNENVVKENIHIKDKNVDNKQENKEHE